MEAETFPSKDGHGKCEQVSFEPWVTSDFLCHLNHFTNILCIFSRRDYEDFLQDLEEDPAYREGVNIYKDRSRMRNDTATTDEGEGPKISLEEMLDDLTLSEAEGDPDWVDVDEDDE